jgi:hypothetical protein
MAIFQFGEVSAIVTDSALVRGAMTAVNWLHRPRVPITYVASLDDAESWARARLADGLTP